ncbi:MAG: hypothetical protein IPO92_05740 [Saprospiraceae bacterium]|nr:hypothetical protein [Saprospiraceae bacterium]
MNLFIAKIKILYSAMLIVLTTWLSGQNPNWQAPVSSAYTFTSNVISIVQLNDIRSNNPDDRVAFFVGNELRGLSKPVMVGSNLYVHFITVYANQAVEMMDIKIYHKITNEVYELTTPFQAVAQNIVGSLAAPFILNAYPENNAPISILNVPNQQTIEGLAFLPIDMLNYLVQPDPFDVAWTYTPNPNLVVSLVEGILNVQGATGFVGQTSLTVRATELLTAPQLSHENNGSRNVVIQSAQTNIIFNITALYPGTALNPIPNQGIVVGGQFATFDLDDYEYQYGGPYLQYGYYPIVLESMDPISQPEWIVDTLYKNTMSITSKIVFTPSYVFNHENDVLAAMIDGQIHGVAKRDPISSLFHISVGGSDNTNMISFKFYSGFRKEIITLYDSIPYKAYDIIGSPDLPICFDLSPLRPMIDANRVTTIAIIDTSWIGIQDFVFTAADSLYPSYLFAGRQASFCVVAQSSDLVTLYADADGDGLGNPNVYIQVCLGSVGYVTDNTDCDDTTPINPVLVIDIAETSGTSDNDGFICSSAPVTLTASGGQSYLWSTGAATAVLNISPLTSSTYTVTMTHASGCQRTKTIQISVEGIVVTQSGNDGFGSLRQVFNCITEGSTITYDQPTTNTSILTAPLLINKNIKIKGLNTMSRPLIQIDYINPENGLSITNTKVLELDNVDISINNNTNGFATISGMGQLIIKSITIVKQ